MPANDMLIRLGKVIRTHRESMKVTQEKFAFENGINVAHYGAIERGRQNLTLLNLLRISQALGQPVSILIGEAERLDIDTAAKQVANPPRRGRPRGSKSRWR